MIGLTYHRKIKVIDSCSSCHTRSIYGLSIKRMQYSKKIIICLNIQILGEKHFDIQEKR